MDVMDDQTAAVGVPAFCPDAAEGSLVNRYYFVKVVEVRPEVGRHARFPRVGGTAQMGALLQS